MLPKIFQNVNIKGCIAVFGASLLAMTLGNFYTVGNLSPYISSYMRIHVDPNSNQVQFVWMTGLFMLGLGSLGWLSGIMTEKFGSRITALIGAVFYSGFFALSTLTVKHSFAAFACTFGYFSWVGASIIWVAAVTQGIRWFPTQTGLSTSIINCGYGIGGVIFNLVGTSLLNPDNQKADELIGHERYFTDEHLLDNVPNYFWIIALIMLGIFCIALPLTFEAPKYKSTPVIEIHDNIAFQKENINNAIAPNEEKFTPNSLDFKIAVNPNTELPNTEANTKPNTKPNTEINIEPNTVLVEITPKEMLKRKEFYLIYITFALLMIPVNFIVSYYKTYGLTFITDDKYLSIVGGVGVFCTCIGKIFWGVLVEKKSYKYVMLAYCILFAILVQALVAAQYLGVQSNVYFIIFVMMNYAFVGGNFTLIPTVITVAFGNKHAATNYGIASSAQSIGSFVGAFICQKIVDTFHWRESFSFMAAFALLAAVITLFMPTDIIDIRKPKVQTLLTTSSHTIETNHL